MFPVILAVIAGYALIAAGVMLTFAPAAVWPDLPFHPGTQDATLGWMIYTLILGFVAAVVGGWVTARIAGARRSRAIMILTVLVAGIGIASAVAKPSPEGAPGGAAGPREPIGYALILPILGGAGVLLGGRLRARRELRSS